VTPNGVV